MVVTQEKTTNEKLLVRFRIPKKTVEIPAESEINHEVSKSGDSASGRPSVKAETIKTDLAPPSSSVPEGTESEQPKSRMVEIECEQEDKTLAVATRLESMPFAI